MSLRRKHPPDSLYLLLDTLCNAFGGIILLAVLVVLLTSKEKGQGEDTPEAQAAIQQLLAAAEARLQAALQYHATLQARLADARLQQQMSLLAARKELEAELEQMRETVAQNARDLESAQAANPAERLKFLTEEKVRAQAAFQTASNDLAAANEKIRQLQDRLADLTAQAAARLKEMQHSLRLPKEHETGRQVAFVIVQYGRLYPTRNLDSTRNSSDLTWTEEGDAEIAHPIPGGGLDPDDFATLCRGESAADKYFAFLVYEDSFPAYIRARQAAVEAGIVYGWEPFRNQDGPIAFSAHGHVPKPQ